MVDVGTSTEVHSPCEVIQSVLREVRGPVALEQFHLIETALPYYIAHGRDIWFVLAVGAVFVLHLHHNDGTALLDCEVANLFAHLLLEDFQTLHEERVLLTQLNIFFLKQPPR